MFWRILFVWSAAFLFSVHCTRDTSPVEPEIPDSSQVIVVTNVDNFDRAAVEIDAFRIDSVTLQGDLLTLFVGYSGGCKKHDFSLYSTNGIYESMPPQGDVFLGHNGNSDMCEAFVHERLVFDLSPLIKSNPDGMGLRLHQYRDTEPFKVIWWRTGL